MRVIIIGGGIGGLTAALSCLHFGHSVQVLERAEIFAEVGAGIQVPPNAMKVLQRLELDQELVRRGFEPERIEARMGRSGQTLFTVPLKGYARQNWGAPYVHIHRADYIDILQNALHQKQSDALFFGAKLDRYYQTNTGITAKLSDGREVEGDILIGADGIRSKVREQLTGSQQPRFTGNIAWRAVVPLEAVKDMAPDPTACAWMGEGRHAVTYRLRGGKLVNFVGVVETPEMIRESWTEKGDLNDLRAHFAGWYPVISNLIEAIDPKDLFKWALFDRDPLGKWGEERVTLLGDAAHPMLPFLAQGAAMAVEDAWVLASELSRKGSAPQDSLERYFQARFDRTRRVQAASRANMKTFHRRTKLGQLSTYGPMWLAAQIMPSIVHRRLDWLYGHDATGA